MEGESAKGIFSHRGQGRNFRFRKRQPDALDRFAEFLADHIDDSDLAAGANLATGEKLPAHARLDPGGNAGTAARRMGLKPQSGNGMLQRIRQRLGPQAR